MVDVVRPERLAMISHLRGELLPVQRFAGPLALVAALEPGARARWLDGLGDEAADVARELAEVERTGVAVERGRSDKLVASVSRAVVPDPGAPVCALTVVGPDAELDGPELASVERELRAAVDELGAALTVGAAEAGR